MSGWPARCSRRRERRVAELERARADVVDDAAATLRRVERDLHDGHCGTPLPANARVIAELHDPDYGVQNRTLPGSPGACRSPR